MAFSLVNSKQTQRMSSVSPAPLLKPGDTAPDFCVVDTKGNTLTLESLSGKKAYIILFRPSACPLCNLTVSRIKKKSAELKKAGVEIIPVFESTPSEMKSFAGTQATDDFPIYIPDPASNYKMYADFGRQRGVVGGIPGCAICFHMCVDCKFYPAAAEFGMNPGFGCPLMNPKAVKQLMCSPRGLMTLPTDIFIENGRIVASHYGKVIGQHIDWKKVEEFAGIKSAPGATEMAR